VTSTGTTFVDGIPESFQAAVLVETSQPLSLLRLKTPDALDFGQVLVKIFQSGACASQVHEIDGRKGRDPHLPHMLGHEAVGEVVGFGPGVSMFGLGDMVVAHWRKAKGIEAAAPKFESSIGQINAGPVTTFSEYSVISENRLTKLPQGIDIDLAPLLGCALTTGYGAVVHEAKVLPGESAVIIGFGGIGISILKTLRMVSAQPILVVDVVQEKLELALKMGADYVIDANEVGVGLSDAIESVIAGKADVVFEATGIRGSIESAYLATSQIGRTVLIGVPDPNDPARIPTLPLHFGKKILGSHGGSSNPDVDIPRIAKLVQSKEIVISDFPTERFKLFDCLKAVACLRNGAKGRVILEMEHGQLPIASMAQELGS
jgi:S-(hydroxymethyl)glutathione dehydrogenase/alcohol dehydrogenase